MPLLALRLTVLALAAACSGAWAQSPRITVSLDQGWRFHAGEQPFAESPTFDDATWSGMSVPHMFPYELHGTHKTVYRGAAWYRKSFTPPASWKGKRVFLRFDAVAIVSDTYLNGTKLGEHRGGFAAFTYEISKDIHFDVPNQLSVRVDDRMNPDVSPQEMSLMYGGIYRHVSLIVTGLVDISPNDFSSPRRLSDAISRNTGSSFGAGAYGNQQ